MRPCYVRNISKFTKDKAMFHTFVQESSVIGPSIAKNGHKGGIVSEPIAIVEYEDGRVAKVNADRIQFVDSKQYFEEYAWGDNDGK